MGFCESLPSVAAPCVRRRCLSLLLCFWWEEYGLVFFFFLKDCLSLGLCSQPQGSRRRLVQQQAHGKSSTPNPEFLSLRIIPDSVTVAHWPCQVLGLALWPLSQGFRTELQRTLKLAPVMAVFECDSYCPTGPGVWASATCRFVRFAFSRLPAISSLETLSLFPSPT